MANWYLSGTRMSGLVLINWDNMSLIQQKILLRKCFEITDVNQLL